MSQWYVSINGQQMGPYEDGVFRSYIQSGRIQSDHLVWREGMSAWEPASSLSEWKHAFPSASVVPPPIMTSPPTSPFATGNTMASTPPAAPPGPVGSKTYPGAMVSLILGAVSYFFGGPFTAIPAIVMGHKARRHLKQNPHMQGLGLAKAGLFLGYTYVAFILVFVGVLLIPYFSIQDKDAEKVCQKHLMELQEVKERWARELNKSPDTVPTWAELEAYLGSDADSLSCPMGGAYVIGAVSEMPTCSYDGD